MPYKGMGRSYKIDTANVLQTLNSFKPSTAQIMAEAAAGSLENIIEMFNPGKLAGLTSQLSRQLAKISPDAQSTVNQEIGQIVSGLQALIAIQRAFQQRAQELKFELRKSQASLSAGQRSAIRKFEAAHRLRAKASQKEGITDLLPAQIAQWIDKDAKLKKLVGMLVKVRDKIDSFDKETTPMFAQMVQLSGDLPGREQRTRVGQNYTEWDKTMAILVDALNEEIQYFVALLDQIQKARTESKNTPKQSARGRQGAGRYQPAKA